MEAAISAVTGELVSQFISFLKNKYYSSLAHSEDKVAERLQHLLVRASTVVEEAEGRYITNSAMLVQLKMLSEAMYRGHHALDTFRYRALEDSGIDDNEVRDPSSLHFAIPLKRSRTTAFARNDKIMYLELHHALERLEAVLANMTEFVMLLGGCERMSRRPYDAYLYIDSFMFSGPTEKQKLLSFLLQQDDSGAVPVLPIIGGPIVGKKTLLAHVCRDERVHSRFSSILHLNGESFLRITDRGRTISGATLVVVEFMSDVDDEDWKKFQSFVTTMSRGSKVIIISRHERLVRFGSVKPFFLNALSYQEFRYLFEILAFGSADPAEYPRLVQIADDFAKQLKWSLVAANAFGHVFRKNLNAQFWLSISSRSTRMIQKNISAYGAHPKLLIAEGHPVNITDLVFHPLSMIPVTADVPVKKESLKVTLGELVADPSVRPKGEFNLLAWESRIPPYTLFSHFVPTCAQDMREETPLTGRKRHMTHPM